MVSRVKHRYRIMRLMWRLLVHDELGHPSPLTALQRLSCLRKGFLSRSVALYDSVAMGRGEYFSDWAKARMSMMYDHRNVRGGYQYGLNNKLFSTAILGHSVRVPSIYGIIEHGRVVPLGEAGRALLRGCWQEICDRAGGCIVFKPTAEGRGNGVFVLAENDGRLAIDGMEVSEDSIKQRISALNEYLLVEFLQQGEYAAGLYPLTTNTIRIITLVDPDNGEIYLPVAVQRIGCRESIPVDNWNRGGICAEIDRESGILGPAAGRRGPMRQLVWQDAHPDTGAAIRGSQVPNWAAIKQKILQAASEIAYFKWLSWDVVVLDDGIAVIEADTVSGIETLQVHRPLLRDARVRRFLEHHGYVKRRKGVLGESEPSPAEASQASC